jgi:hypothetical protein
MGINNQAKSLSSLKTLRDFSIFLTFISRFLRAVGRVFKTDYLGLYLESYKSLLKSIFHYLMINGFFVFFGNLNKMIFEP